MLDPIDRNRLVQVPDVAEPSELLGMLQHPDPSALMSLQVVLAAITIALVASLETLLNLEAVDKIDPHKRTSPPDRELLAQGVGNATAGLLGGLPVTSVIVRSSVNINSGGKTKLAAILHGGWLLVAVVLIPTWINRIPFAALAAVLIATGFKLAHPTLFRHMWARGREVFLPFATTVVMILATDLLIGVVSGLTVGIVFILRASQKSAIRRVLEKHLTGDVLRIELPEQVTVLNRSTIAQALDEVEPGSRVLLDARRSRYVDADILSTIVDYQQEVAPARQVRFETIGLRKHYEQAPEDVQSVDYVTRELRDRSNPKQIVELLEAGNERFRSGRPLVRDLQEVRAASATQQNPLAVVFSGTSSRTPVEAIFDVGVGTLSCVRTTGNALCSAVLGSLEYAVVVDGAKVIVVMGHTRNEAIRRVMERRRGDSEEVSSVEHLEPLLEDVADDVNSDLHAEQEGTTAGRPDVDTAARRRTTLVAREILASSPAIRRAVSSGEVGMVCCMYDVQAGHAEFFESPSGDQAKPEAEPLPVHGHI